MATPWTYFLRLSLSSVVLTDSATGSPVHVLMLSTQVVRGLPRLHSPGIVPCIPWGVLVVVVVLFFSRTRDPRVGHTMDVLSPFIPVLRHCDLTLPLGVLSTSSSLTLTLLRRIARPPVQAGRAVPTTVQTPAPAEASEVPAGYTDQVRSIIDIDKLSTRGRRDDTPPMAVRLAADLRSSAGGGSAVRTWLSCRQPACLQPRLGQTDGRIAISLNPPPLRRRHNKYLHVDTLLANQTARNTSPPIIPKVAIATRRRTARVIISLTFLTSYSEADRRQKPMT